MSDEPVQLPDSQPAPGEAQTLPLWRPSLFWPILWFTLAAVAAKAAMLGVPALRIPAYRWPFVIELITIAQADVLFGLLAGAAGWGLLWVTQDLPGLRRLVHRVLLAAAMAGVAVSIINIAVFDYCRAPLAYAMLDIGGIGWLWYVVSGGVFLLAVVAAAGYLLAVWASQRWLPIGGRRGLILWGVALVLAVAVIAAGQWRLRSDWRPWYDNPRIATSPHWQFIRSCIVELTGHGGALCFGAADPETAKSLLPAGQRDGRGEPTPGLGRGPKNVILIVLESVPTRYMSLYGSKYATTPHLQAEAEHCLVFPNIYSPFTNSGNAMVAMLMSRQAPLTWREQMLERPDLPGNAVSDVLKGGRYRTALVSSQIFAHANGLEFLKRHGFDTLWDYDDSDSPRSAWWGVDDGCMVDMTLKWIDQGPADRPFLIFCWNQGTHYPWDPAPGQADIDFVKDYGRGQIDEQLNRYLNNLHFADRQLGRLFDELRRRKLDDKTLVVITGDHGASFYEHHDSFDHSGNVYQEDINVPLILWSPVLFQDAERPAVVGGLVDVSPTIFDLLGLQLDSGWRGHSLLSPKHPNRAFVYGCRNDYLLGMRERNFKYIANTTASRDELYDLSVDPTEQTNIAEKHRKQCLVFRKRVAAWVQANW